MLTRLPSGLNGRGFIEQFERSVRNIPDRPLSYLSNDCSVLNTPTDQRRLNGRSRDIAAIGGVNLTGIKVAFAAQELYPTGHPKSTLADGAARILRSALACRAMDMATFAGDPSRTDHANQPQAIHRHGDADMASVGNL